MRCIRLVAMAPVLALCVPLFGIAPVGAAERPQPKLIVTIVVDQYSSDLFTRYRPTYNPKVNGLARLASGVVFPRGHQGHAATETCPGHSTILTGAWPARTGIVANDWQDPALRRKSDGADTFSIYCVEKPGEKDSDAKKRVISPGFLLVPTLGERMHARDPNSRVVAVAGKDRSAVMLGGAKADLTLWWTEKGFETYRGEESRIPIAISNPGHDDDKNTVNYKVRASYASRTVPTLPASCANDTLKVDVPPKASVGVLQATEPNSKRWRATPAMDSLTVDAALEAMKALQLGQRSSIDLLAVSLSANDYVGHYFGTAGPEMCAQQVALDQSIGRLLAALDKTGVSYVVAFTADHGGLDLPERNRLRGIPSAQRISAELLPGKMGAELAKELGLSVNVVLGKNEFGNDVYLNPEIPPDQRAAALEAAARKYRAHPQVASVFTRNELIAAERPTRPVDEWTLLERAKASFNASRSGDLIVLLKPYVTTYLSPANLDTDYVASHGSPWGYDRRVPILFWWKGVRGFDQPTAVQTVDIVPTLASLIGLEINANEIDGHALPIVLDSR